jgi:hypothetical protein
MFIAKKCCDQFVVRVQRDPFFNCSIDLLKRSQRNKQSTTELTTEPHSRRASWQKSAQEIAPELSEAARSRGIVSSTASFSTFSHSSAGSTPAFFSCAPLSRLLARGSLRQNVASSREVAPRSGGVQRRTLSTGRAGSWRAVVLRQAGAEFISVSGQCAARSAHFSDLRNHKRSSGGVAATEHLHAPMNSPTGAALQGTAQRVSFSTSAHKCIEGDSSWQ